MKALIILLLSVATAYAVPTGTYTKAVSVDTNGVLTGSSTNFADVNGLVRTGTVLVVETDPIYSATSAVVLAHVNSKHSISMPGGFQGGTDATADYGGAVGFQAVADAGGAVGRASAATFGGAVGFQAKAGYGFAGGASAIATTDGTGSGTGINAIQLGAGGNTNPLTLGVYGYQLMASNGVIPIARLNFSGCATSESGLPSGTPWNSNGFLRIAP